jgi:hypothetical protein
MVAPITPQNVQSPQSVTRKRRLADAMMQQGTDTSPVGHPLGALARAMQGGMAGYMSHKADTAESEGRAGAMSRLTEAMANKNMGTADYMNIASDPWMPEGASPLVGAMFKSHLDAQAPKDPIEVDGRLIDPTTHKVLYDSPADPVKMEKLNDYMLFNPVTGATQTVEGASAIDPDRQDRISAAVNSTYHKERLDVTQPILNSMEQSIDDPRATADLNFIYGPAKILDPEGSVRDQDAAAMSMAQSLPKAWQGQVLQALAGKGKLSREVRIGLYELARSRVEQFHKGASEMRDYYASTAPGYQTPPIPAMSKWQDQNMQTPTGMAQQSGQSPQPTMPPPPPGVNPLEWQHMTPEERALWNQ